jgi:hypothetical protein
MPVQSDLFYFSLNGGPNTIAQFSKTSYRSARITIQASSNNEHSLSEIYVLHDNENVYIRELDFIYTIDPFVDYTATIDTNNVYIMANTTLPNTDLVIFANLFDNPVTSADDSIDLEKIIETSSTISSLLPEDKTDYAAQLTSSLNKESDVMNFNRKINDSLEYMTSSAFTALSNTAQATFISSLADFINNTSNTLSESVQSDVQAFYDTSKKIESMSTLTNINLGYSNDNTKGLLQKILNANGKSLFG